MNSKTSRTARYLLCVLSLGVTAGAAVGVWQRYREFLAKGSIVPSFLIICLVLIIGILFIQTLLWKPQLLSPFNALKKMPDFVRWAGAFLLCISPVILYAFHRWSEPYGNPWIRVFVYGLMILLAAWLLTKEDGVSFQASLSAALIFSVAFMLINQFRDVTGYPFSNGWSEGNRIWDYSVLFGRDLYNWPQDQKIPAYIDLGRQSLWGSIFLLPNVSIRMMRAWNDILFTIPYALLGWALFRKNQSLSKGIMLGIVLWAMLFLNQGPIYTPLVIAALLVAVGHKCPFWLNCLVTAAAGAYALMSRSTWIAAPAAFAGLLTLADTWKNQHMSQRTRWTRTIVIGVCGLLGAVLFLQKNTITSFITGQAQTNQTESSLRADYYEEDPRSQQIEVAIVPESETDSPAMFTPAWIKSFISRQPLLWDRLWPNETYKPGIVLGLLMAVLPLILIIIFWDRQADWGITKWQRIGLGLVLLAFLAAGLLVSVKIGGGSNLHNLDMFLIALLFVAAIAWNAGMGKWITGKIQSGNWICWILMAAILLPVLPDMLSIEPKKYPAEETTVDALTQIQSLVTEHTDEEILFMDQRQLLTFGNVPKISLIADYEKKWMMDEAMADNAEWFQPYIEDLKNQRFGLIISEPLWIKFQGANLNFSEENDLFVKWVSIPTLCYYEPLETFQEQGVQILIPRESVYQQDGITCP